MLLGKPLGLSYPKIKNDQTLAVQSSCLLPQRCLLPRAEVNQGIVSMRYCSGGVESVDTLSSASSSSSSILGNAPTNIWDETSSRQKSFLRNGFGCFSSPPLMVLLFIPSSRLCVGM